MDLGFFDFSENVDFWCFPVGFWVWEDVQSIDASSGIQIDGFSARTEPPGSIFDDAHDLGVFACVFCFLTLPPRGLMTVCDCHPSWGYQIRPERVPLGSFQFHFCRFGICVVRIRNLSVVPTLPWGGNKNKIDTAIYWMRSSASVWFRCGTLTLKRCHVF